MPNLQEIKKLSELMVSEILDQEEFVLYYNFCLSDLSEIINYEKNMEEFTIDSNENNTQLPSDLFQVISVVVEETNSSSNNKKRLVNEASVNSDIAIEGLSFKGQFDKRTEIYTRWENKISIKSIYLDDSGVSSNPLKVNIKYYATLPTLDIEDTTLDLKQYPPIKEQHYHSIIAYYIAYMYFSNADMLEDANTKFNSYMIKRKEIKDYVFKHRKSSSFNDKVKKVRH